jgi:3-oxoacyl-[acyl-carrier protein] reductase
MNRLTNKTAVITGCNRGIGKAILVKFASEGANIVACTRKIDDALSLFYEELEQSYNVKIYPITMDLECEESIKEAMRNVRSLKLHIDILVNNAGIASGGFMLMTPLSEIRKVFQINYFAQVMITQHIAKMMMSNKRGSIIFMSSVLGLDSYQGGSAYGASKAAISLLTKSASKELGAFGIRVNAIAPNLVDTDMAKLMEVKSYDKMISGSALNRLASTDEIANTALFLASDESSYITGQTIRVDGGL